MPSNAIRPLWSACNVYYIKWKATCSLAMNSDLDLACFLL